MIVAGAGEVVLVAETVFTHLCMKFFFVFLAMYSISWKGEAFFHHEALLWLAVTEYFRG